MTARARTSRASRAPRLGAVLVLTSLLVLLPGLAAPAPADTCTVPGTHTSVQSAVDDPVCSTIELADQAYPESVNIPRSVQIAGPVTGTAAIEGLLRVVGSDTEVELERLRIENGCRDQAILVREGAEVAGSELDVVHSQSLSCPRSVIFSDGFESGDISAWSRSVP